jgi:acyl-CoA thioesterase I
MMQRRQCSAALLTAGLLGFSGFAQAQVRTGPVLVLGDSLSAEYGLLRGRGWVALLEKELAARKRPITVVNASISGDTTSGGLARLSRLLDKHAPSVVVLELGGNDALRGLPLDMTERNLASMLVQCKAAHAKVVLLGMQVPPNYGPRYATQFSELYARLARTHQARLVPQFLKQVADAPDPLKWFQADSIHPNEAAQPRLLANVMPELSTLLP